MPAPHACTIDLARPGGAVHQWVARTLAELKADGPRAPVTLVVPNYYAGRQIGWALAADDGYVNVRTLLIGDLAEQVLGVRMSSLSPLTSVVEQIGRASWRE